MSLTRLLPPLCSPALFVFALLPVMLIGLTAKGGIAAMDRWTPTHLDLEVRLDPEREVLETRGSLTLRCDDENSSGPVLALNGRDPVTEFVEIEGPDVAKAELNELDPEDEALRLARITLREPAVKGEQVELRFQCAMQGKGFQIRVDSDIATASWTDGWYPAPVDDDDRSLSQRMAAPGRTTLHLPREWTSLTEGRFVRREEAGETATEEWQLEVPMARSFAAGPYVVAREQFGDRDVSVYLLEADPPTAKRQAEVLANAIEAMETRFGAFPYPSYGIAQVPAGRFSWSAASQQGLILADPTCFIGEEGNLPLFAHEAAHAWWGNLVGTRGPGSILCSESLAQYGAVVAIEGVRGVEAATDFLRFSAPGYSPQQCAKGYFEIVAMGEDRPLSELGSGGWQHQLSDAKGHWVYHMLRRRVGDELFFATLRGLIETYAGHQMGLDDLRAAFLDAAPSELHLTRFFEQWLDRVGAPDLEVEWSVSAAGTVEGIVRQLQPADPYDLDVDLLATAADGHEVGSVVLQVSDRETPFSLPVRDPATELIVDPDYRILRWLPEYGNRPTFESASSSPGDRPAVKSPQEAEGRISDFEGGHIASGFGSGWRSSCDQVFGGASSAAVELADGGAEGSAHALRIYGELKPGAPLLFGGAMFYPGDEPMASSDLSAWSGLRFRARGSDRDYVLGVFTSANPSMPQTKPFHASGDWTEVQVDFREFEGLDSSDVTAFFFGASQDPGPMELWIDEVRLVEHVSR